MKGAWGLKAKLETVRSIGLIPTTGRALYVLPGINTTSLSRLSRRLDENKGRDRAMSSPAAVTKGQGNLAGSCFGLDCRDRSTTAVVVPCEGIWLPALVLHRSTLMALESCARTLHKQ